MRIRHLLVIAALACGCAAAQNPARELDVLPAVATTKLAKSLDEAAAHAQHVWRDTPSTNADGTVNAYIEIGRGDRRKWEFDIRANARAIDRMIGEDVGGYPINYGFVPQTVSYDGDPFDALVLGPPMEGQMVRGVAVGFMYMEDEKGPDSKVVLSLVGPDGQPRDALTGSEQQMVGDYFKRYKLNEPGAFSKVPGWGTIAEGLEQVRISHAFFVECRNRAGQTCQIAPR